MCATILYLTNATNRRYDYTYEPSSLLLAYIPNIYNSHTTTTCSDGKVHRKRTEKTVHKQVGQPLEVASDTGRSRIVESSGNPHRGQDREQVH